MLRRSNVSGQCRAARGKDLDNPVAEPPGGKGQVLAIIPQPPTEPAPARAPGDRDAAHRLGPSGPGLEAVLKAPGVKCPLRDPHAGESGVGRKSPDSLYSERHVTFEDDAGAYDQQDAAGFIKLNALRLRLLGQRDRA